MNSLQLRYLFWTSLVLLILVGCQTAPPSAPISPPSPSLEATSGPTPTPFALPTLFPTNTPLVSPTPWPTSGPAATAVPRTPIPFDQIVVSVEYQIPAIGLYRRLEGNVASQIILTDEVTGQTTTLSNQPGNLLQIQQSLTELSLAERPENCDRCVYIRYELPAGQIQGEGWLQDLLLLASLDHFTSLHLGPHFPPNTVMGLRRNASTYDVAQTLALTADGRLYIWQGVMDEIPPPQEAAAELAAWRAEIAALPIDDLQRRYAAACGGAPYETLRLDDIEIIIICPALSLPGVLIPLYSDISAAMAAALPAPEIAPPVYPLALNEWLVYQQPDGTRLTLDAADLATIVTADTAVLTATFALTNTSTLSLTLALQESGALGLGTAALETEWPAFLILRGPLAVSSLGWETEPPAALRPLIASLDAWLSELLTEE